MSISSRSRVRGGKAAEVIDTCEQIQQMEHIETDMIRKRRTFSFFLVLLLLCGFIIPMFVQFVTNACDNIRLPEETSGDSGAFNHQLFLCFLVVIIIRR